MLFCPEDLLILKTGAEKRRKLLDNALCQLRPGYAKALSEYQRLLEHKSRILKDWREKPGLLDTLPDFTFAWRSSARHRCLPRQLFQKLARLTAQVHQQFSGGRETLSITYETVSTVENPLAPRAEIEGQILEHQEAHLRAEIESGQCLTGPHRTILKCSSTA